MTAPSHAAALMTADQYRAEAQRLLGVCGEVEPEFCDHFVQCAQVYALLAISAQAAENASDLPF